MNKTARYKRLYEQTGELLSRSPSSIAAMATTAAILFNKMEYFSWCGFYYLRDGELIVGPYQGPVACQVLKKKQGVCWAAITQNRPLLVPDVELFDGHIACDSRTRSELVVPVCDAGGSVKAVLDIDSHKTGIFDDDDIAGLSRIITLLEPLNI